MKKRFEVYCGNALTVLKKMRKNSVHCIVTSPPYFQLRDYQRKQQIGLEPDLQDYLQNLYDVFAECKRVLKPKGTLWVNLGDTYNSSLERTTHRGVKVSQRELSRKCQLGIPFRFAIGMMDNYGWILRNDVIWAKTNGKPESVQDRFSNKHEFILFFAQSDGYYFDLETIKDLQKPSSLVRQTRNTSDNRQKYSLGRVGKYAEGLTKAKTGTSKVQTKRNPTDVTDFWDVAVNARKTGHYAVYPEEILVKPILAGCPKNGIVLDPFCGSGTTGLVALQQKRQFIGIDVNGTFCKDARKSLAKLEKKLYPKKR